jgi:hypothetical protein
MNKYITILILILASNLYGANLTETNNVTFKGVVTFSNTVNGVITSNQTEYLGAPVVISNNVNNITNLTVTSAWSLTNTYFYTILNTCQVTWAISGFPSTRQAELMISMHCKSNVNNHVLPTNALRLNNGTFTATAPSIRSNAVMIFIHSPQQYWYMCATNNALIGTP